MLRNLQERRTGIAMAVRATSSPVRRLPIFDDDTHSPQRVKAGGFASSGLQTPSIRPAACVRFRMPCLPVKPVAQRHPPTGADRLIVNLRQPACLAPRTRLSRFRRGRGLSRRSHAARCAHSRRLFEPCQFGLIAIVFSLSQRTRQEKPISFISAGLTIAAPPACRAGRLLKAVWREAASRPRHPPAR